MRSLNVAFLIAATPLVIVACGSNDTELGNVGANAGTADCDGNSQNGAETDIANDPLNCGSCGATCSPAETCVTGVCSGNGTAGTGGGSGCTAEACDGVDNDCDGVIDNGCTPASCQPGSADCDGNPANGCETDLESSASNCGSCGTACAAGESCVQSVCQPGGGTCTPAAELCDGKDNDCDGVVDDAAPCGPGQACQAGLCTGNGAACPSGFADCDGNPIDFCETDLTSDNQNCGACGQACAPSQQCSGGACS
jgi:hypothetical protein